MCGEIDENIQINIDLLERFTVMSKMLGLIQPGTVASGPTNLETSEGRSAYMEHIFKLGLSRSLTDASAAIEGEAVDAIASQAIAFGRLAGFLAGQLPPDADLFRAVIESVTEGYAETNKLERQHRDNQAHAHGHSHDEHHHH